MGPNPVMKLLSCVPLPCPLVPSHIPVITSSSTREYTVTEPGQDGAAPSRTHTYQWRQTVTFQECVHDDSRPALPSTQQLSVDSVFVLYNQEERVLRYALSNSIGPVRGAEPLAPCAVPQTLLAAVCVKKSLFHTGLWSFALSL
jgi:hypothetical protein